MGALVWGASSFFTEAPSNYGSFERSPAAERAIGTALGIARWGGEDALITWLKDPEVNTRPEVFVLDPSGHEISGRSIPQKAAESLANSGPQEGVYTMRGHGRHMRPFQGYRFFAVRTDIPPSPIRLIMWKMPWWGWALIAALISVFVAGSVAWTSTRPIKNCNGPCKRLLKVSLTFALPTKSGTNTMKSVNSPVSLTPWPNAFTDSLTDKNASFTT